MNGLRRPGGLEITKRAFDVCALERTARVLDIGCGEGHAAAFLKSEYDLDVTGIDISAQAVSQAALDHPGPEFIEGDGQAPGFGPLSFDCVLMECSLSLMENPAEAIYEAVRMLKHGGYLIVHDLYLLNPDERELNIAGSAGQQDAALDAGRICCVTQQPVYVKNGALVLAGISAVFDELGLETVLFEDRKNDLDGYAASLTLDGLCPGCRPGDAQSGQKMSYFLLVAQKKTGETAVLAQSYSVCPVCLKRTGAAYVEKNGSVYLDKECKEHGFFSCLISRDADDYKRWKADAVSIRPKDILRRTAKGCPHDCGPCENHLQTACCVLIDVTNRCDQNCAVCFASASQSETREPELCEIERKLDTLAFLSEARKFNIQLSGGEPTVRIDLPEIVAIAKTKGFEYVQLNTNGKRLGSDEGYAFILKEAGVDAVFLQFDGMTDVVYETLRNEKLLGIKKRAVENCRRARLPVALVPTVVRGINDKEIGGIIQYMLDNVDVVKGVHFQPVSFFGRFPSGFDEEQRFTMFDAINEIERQTNGHFLKKDLAPISAGHNLCCFTAHYLRQEDGSVSCLSSQTRQAEACCTPDIEIISKDRDYVLNKWKMAEAETECPCSDGFDAFINKMRQSSFTLTGMAFQDVMSLDTERLRRCRVQVLSEDDMLIPFCAYNLTNASGQYLYRGRKQ